MEDLPDENVSHLKRFKAAAAAWVCDGYTLDVRFIAQKSDGKNDAILWDASIVLSPLPPKGDRNFFLEVDDVIVSQTQIRIDKIQDAETIIERAGVGFLTHANGRTFVLPHANRGPKYGSGLIDRQAWFSPLRLTVSLGPRGSFTPPVLSGIDDALRLAEPPFDGLADVAGWLGLREPGTEPLTVPQITCEIVPPADIRFDQCSLTSDQLLVTVAAHPNFDTSTLRLAVRAVPGNFMLGRKQIADRLEWKDEDGLRKGTALVHLPDSDQVLLMLMIGNATVRRTWILDPTKARNNRLLTVQHFDKELKKLTDALTTAADGRLFERGIASLLFLLGFSPVLTLDNDATDLIVATPGGQLILVECTLKTADFRNKAGKLVDRRGSLTKALQESGHALNVVAVLVCGVPRDQVAADAEDVRSLGIVLVSREDIDAAFNQRRAPRNPDELIQAALENLTNASGATASPPENA
ncbi:hypothetical protein [Paraburkholderia sp. RL17-347-BIC-D]|uniref:hypothetical protein n=1 Tax=Paraburkholderia sp. RL17-347-BIC-D TaxID=3031632 RepID=UPI0038BDE3AD